MQVKSPPSLLSLKLISSAKDLAESTPRSQVQEALCRQFGESGTDSLSTKGILLELQQLQGDCRQSLTRRSIHQHILFVVLPDPLSHHLQLG